MKFVFLFFFLVIIKNDFRLESLVTLDKLGRFQGKYKKFSLVRKLVLSSVCRRGFFLFEGFVWWSVSGRQVIGSFKQVQKNFSFEKLAYQEKYKKYFLWVEKFFGVRIFWLSVPSWSAMEFFQMGVKNFFLKN